MNGLASVDRGLGDFAQASEWYSKGLKTAVETHGYDHPLTWTLMTGSVEMLHKIRKHRTAKDTFLKAVEAIAQVHQLEPVVAGDGADPESSLNNAHERVFPIVRKLLGAKHSSTIGYMNYIGTRKKDEGFNSSALVLKIVSLVSQAKFL
jgi:hypothetical protein